MNLEQAREVLQKEFDNNIFESEETKDAIGTILYHLSPVESNLTNRAKKELELTGLLSDFSLGENDIYGGMIGKAVMELMNLFAKQGHSGMSADLTSVLFKRLANYEILSPLTGEDDEWNTIDEKSGYCQNKRDGKVFKENGKAYYIEAIQKRDENGELWSGAFEMEGKMYGVRGYIKEFPHTPKTFVIDVISKEDIDEVKDINQLEEVKKYYDLYELS